MKKIFFLGFFLQVLCLVVPGQVSLRNLLTENLTDPVGLDTHVPRFSWQLVSDKRSSSQVAYEIKLSSGKSTVWNTGKVMSS